MVAERGVVSGSGARPEVNDHADAPLNHKGSGEHHHVEQGDDAAREVFGKLLGESGVNQDARSAEETVELIRQALNLYGVK